MATNLKPSTILDEYEAAKTQFEGKATPDTFEAELQNRLLNREVAPGVAREERETFKKFFTAPSSIRERLGSDVNPLQAEQIIGSRQANWIDQLSGLKGIREQKQESIKDIIASTALGYQTEYDMADRKMTLAWNEYKEAVRQEEDASRSSAITKEMKEMQQYIYMNNIRTKMNQEMDARAEAEGDAWDGKMGADKYMSFMNDVVRDLGPGMKDEFLEEFKVHRWVKDSETNLQELQKQEGINYWDSLRDMTDNAKATDLISNLDDAVEIKSEQMFKDIKNLAREYIPQLNEPTTTGEYDLIVEPANPFQEYFLDALQRAFGETEGQAVFERLFGFSGGVTSSPGEPIKFQGFQAPKINQGSSIE